MAYKHADLPSRSDPNYMKLYREKRKQTGLDKEYNKNYYKKRIEENPNYNREKYDKEKSAVYRENNREYFREKNWARRGIDGITYEKYLFDLKEQKGRCMICHGEMNKPHVDHDHNTGKYRGLLCTSCNTGLGIYEKMKDKFEHYLSKDLTKDQ
jgi:hypothetical protein